MPGPSPASTPASTPSIWHATAQREIYPALQHDLVVDVAIIGGGITGLTAAERLLRAGRRVALIEMREVGGGETGQTTAHLTELADTRYSVLESDFGVEGATLVGRTHREAIDHIGNLISAYGIQCGFERVPAYLYSEHKKDLEWVRAELDAARRAGVWGEWALRIPLPFAKGGARFPNQAQFHPLRYLWRLAEALARDGLQIFEHTKAVRVVEEDLCRVETEHGMIAAESVLVAANIPVNNWAVTIPSLPAYRTYAIAAPFDVDLEGLYWDSDDPYHYTRAQEIDGRRMLIVGGEDHKVGTVVDTNQCFARLEEYLDDRFVTGPVEYRWSGQIIEPVDGLPVIGPNLLQSRVYIASGYSGNGITWGTAAGTIVADMMLRKPTPYADLYSPTRFTPLASAKDFILENIEYPRYFVLDRLTTLDVTAKSADDVPAGEGRIVAIDGEKYALYRDARGEVRALSPVCTHMGCDVRWNQAERTWDCPCHGSRFSTEGHVLNGPAVRDLDVKTVPKSVVRSSTVD
jgi:glycine/D-amino acid oxidase-like deaminating enzyme/nitrite reductase/ring-hydroxylating ferredoxin subunit